MRRIEKSVVGIGTKVQRHKVTKGCGKMVYLLGAFVPLCLKLPDSADSG